LNRYYLFYNIDAMLFSMSFEIVGEPCSKSVINQYCLDTKQVPTLEHIQDYEFVRNQKIAI